MGLFDFMSMGDNYADRKVDNFTDGKMTVDTCAVNDSEQPFETGIQHPSYNGGDWVIVELYDTKELAQDGHARWVKKMTAKKLPPSLADVSTCTVAQMIDGVSKNVDWRKMKAKK